MVFRFFESAEFAEQVPQVVMTAGQFLEYRHFRVGFLSVFLQLLEDANTLTVGVLGFLMMPQTGFDAAHRAVRDTTLSFLLGTGWGSFGLSSIVCEGNGE